MYKDDVPVLERSSETFSNLPRTTQLDSTSGLWHRSRATLKGQGPWAVWAGGKEVGEGKGIKAGAFLSKSRRLHSNGESKHRKGNWKGRERLLQKGRESLGCIQGEYS